MDASSRREILIVAREAIRNELSGTSHSAPTPTLEFASCGGAFVSLFRGGRLRGCMGTFSPHATLKETVESVARSACRDPRFIRHPVSLQELPTLAIEVSIVSPPEPTDDPLSLRVGMDGILIQRGERSGCFLPQVAVERRWSAEEFLTQCCTMKAGLPPGAWNEPETSVLVFQTDVIRESVPD